jgi:hypothetical protein
VISSLPLNSSEQGQRFELESGWEILVDSSGRMQRDQARREPGWRAARVGLSWNVQFDDLRNYMGAAWYRLTFELPEFRNTRHVLLKFGAVDYFCEVFVNDLLVGTHEGGYTPFSFEITSAVHPGANELMIRVIDPPSDEVQNRALFPEMMYNEIPHGKQNWYVQNSGIWQGVRVELCPSIYIERLDVTPKLNGDFELFARLAGIGLNADNGVIAAQSHLEVRIFDNSGLCVFLHTQGINGSVPVTQVKGNIADPHPWSPENPSLYFVTVSLSGAVQYTRITRFGFRALEAKDGKLYLNGSPFYMMAALDQDFYPETVHTPTSEMFVRDMMLKAKRLGINLLRCHLKVAHPVYLDVADEVGMLIWAELPSWSDSWFPADHFSTMAAVRADKMFWEILIRDWNHPCVVLQTIINESWGINLQHASQREWLLATFDRIKGLLEPLGRLVVDNSPCEGNFHLKTDIEDFHQYYSMPDHVEKWNEWLAALAARPEWTFSPYGDAQRTRREPLLVSEFGNWGLPKLPDKLPWWFEVSFGGREVTRPAGVLERFDRYGFKKLFGTFNQFAEETQWHQFASLKYEIESIRSHESVQGYVITGITDVHWEVNGLLDMWRNDKAYAQQMSALQRPDLVICQLESHCFYGGDSVEIPVLISHFSTVDLRGARVRWSIDSGAGGQFVIDKVIPPGSVAHLPSIHLQLPRVSENTTERLEIEVRLRNGNRVTDNSYDLYLLPPGTAATLGNVRVQGEGLNALRAKLEKAGSGRNGDNSETVLIVERYDESVAAYLQEGGRVLLIASSEDAFPSDWPIKVQPRTGTELDGRWFSNFNWIRSDCPPFQSLAFSPVLGFESMRVAPEYVIRNIAPEQFDDVLSGITFGWLNNNSALLAQMQVGGGKLLATTFKFDSYGTDPYSTALLDALIHYALSADLQPTLDMPLVTLAEKGR